MNIQISFFGRLRHWVYLLCILQIPVMAQVKAGNRLHLDLQQQTFWGDYVWKNNVSSTIFPGVGVRWDQTEYGLGLEFAQDQMTWKRTARVGGALVTPNQKSDFGQLLLVVRKNFKISSDARGTCVAGPGLRWYRGYDARLQEWGSEGVWGLRLGLELEHNLYSRPAGGLELTLGQGAYWEQFADHNNPRLGEENLILSLRLGLGWGFL